MTLGLVLAVLSTFGAGPYPVPEATIQLGPPSERDSLGHSVGRHDLGGPHSKPAPLVAFVRPLPDPMAVRSVAGLSISGTASWGNGWSGVVTRLPRGTPICVTGPISKWCGLSVGYGPAISTHRIADLSKTVFTSICGDPKIGLCRVTLTW